MESIDNICFHVLWDSRACGQVLCAAEGICNSQTCLEENCSYRFPEGQKAGESGPDSSNGSCLISRDLVAVCLLQGMRQVIYVTGRSPSFVSSSVYCKGPVVRTIINSPTSLVLVQG